VGRDPCDETWGVEEADEAVSPRKKMDAEFWIVLWLALAIVLVPMLVVFLR
jgi:predicted nucleic acid-binding Zn ribbon protein